MPKNMLSDKVWDREKMNIHIPYYERTNYKTSEFQAAKDSAIDAIEELLIMLPANDAVCGMTKVLGDWLLSEIKALPEDLIWRNSDEQED